MCFLLFFKNYEVCSLRFSNCLMIVYCIFTFSLCNKDCALSDDILFTDLFDHDHTGTINLQEFGQLFNFINQWIEVYRRFDKDNSGTISEHELMSGTEGSDFKFRALFSNAILVEGFPTIMIFKQ